MKIFLTLDYELFMGPVQGSVYNSLITPVSHLLDVLDPLGIKATFFVDAAYLYRLSVLARGNEKAAKDFETTREHVRFLAQNGHSIQMHFHPQWLYSNISKDTWVMDYAHYKITDMTRDEFKFFFANAFQLLQSLLNAPIKVFRAGGYSMGSAFDTMNVLYDLGINIDSSVLRGGSSKTRFQHYNYKKTPQKAHYRFEDDLTQESMDGRFVEYPISTYKTSPLCYIIRKRLCVKNDKSTKWGDGIGVACRLSKKQRLKTIFFSLFSKKVIPASIDTPFSCCLEQNYKYCISKGYDEMVVIGHPKNLSPGSLMDFRMFVERHPEVSFRIFT